MASPCAVRLGTGTSWYQLVPKSTPFYTHCDSRDFTLNNQALAYIGRRMTKPDLAFMRDTLRPPWYSRVPAMSSSPSTRPPPALPLLSAATEQDHRARLIVAMVAAVTERGYAETTIADVV